MNLILLGVRPKYQKYIEETEETDAWSEEGESLGLRPLASRGGGHSKDIAHSRGGGSAQR